MRIKIVFGLLLSLFVGFGAMVAMRGTKPHQAPTPPAARTAPSADAPVLASASASAAGSSSAAPVDAGAPKLMDRSLRVAALGWDLAAAGVLANGGLDPAPNSDFSAAGLNMHLSALDTMAAVEGALARGGADKDGADIAVLPYSQFVASYERLRALSPEAFFVVGWSRGREALISSKDTLPLPDAKGDVRELKMMGVAGEPATFLGLFALDTAGVPVGSVRLIGADVRTDEVTLAAVDRDAAPLDSVRHFILLTTADATRLVPFVAVAQHGLLDRNKKAVSVWARTWLDGMKKLGSDPAAAARQIATAQGAPEPITLLKRLGQITPATLTDNARMAALSGRGALTLDTLFQQTWRIWRTAGVLATPAPELSPVNTSVIAALVRSNPELITPPPAQSGAGTAAKTQTNGADSAKAMITHRQLEGKFDEQALADAIALYADIFERSALRVVVNRGAAVDTAATKHAMDRAEERFDSANGRVIAGKKALTKVSASVEIVAAP